jgi:hypothetical protein
MTLMQTRPTAAPTGSVDAIVRQATEAERERIADSLQSEVISGLLSLSFMLGKTRSAATDPVEAQYADEALHQVDAVLKNIRNAIHPI